MLTVGCRSDRNLNPSLHTFAQGNNGSLILLLRLGDKRGLSLGELIRPKCITILYRNSPLFIDIFHIMMLFLCCFGLFYTVCNFPVPKQQTQDSAEKSGH